MESELETEESGLRVIIIFAIALVLGGCALGLELMFPTKVLVAVVYIAPILLARLLNQLTQVVLLAAAVSIFPLTGQLLASESLLSEGSIDRWLLIAVIWLVAMVDWFYRLTRSRAEALEKAGPSTTRATLAQGHAGGASARGGAHAAVSSTSLDDVVASLIEPAIVFDGSGRVQGFNDAARRLFGYEAAMMGSLDAERLSPDNRTSSHERQLRDLFSQGGVSSTVHGEIAARRRDGGRFVTEVAISEVHREEGSSYLAIIRDQTQARERLAQAARGARRKGIGEIGQLTGDISERMAREISIITGNLDLLDGEIKKVATAAQYFEPIGEAIDEVAKLNRELMNLGKPIRLDLSPLDLSQAVQTLQPDLQAILGEKVKLEIDAPRLRFRVMADQAQFEETVRELVRNAARAMPKGGNVQIATKRLVITEGDSHLYGNLPAGSYIEVSFTDNGSGMESDVSARAFEPFFTTQESGNHVGLGLNKARDFLAHCGGRLAMGTEEEKGTVASLIFPIYHELGEGEAPLSAQAATYSARPDPKRTVLVVSSDAETRKVRSRLIVSLGQHAPIAATLEDALKQIAENAAIDLVFIDADFAPTVSGVAFAERARALRPNLKFLFALTGAEHDEIKLANAEIVRAPIWRRDVAARLRSMLGEG